MSTGYDRRRCVRCGDFHWRKPDFDTCLRCTPIAPCKNCGCRRAVETITEECAKCDRRGEKKYNEKRKAARRSTHKEATKSATRYARDRKSGAQHRVGYTDEERKARPVKCKTGCHDLPWRRPLKGKCKCGKVWEAEPEPGRASVLGSAMGTVCRLGGR